MAFICVVNFLFNLKPGEMKRSLIFFRIILVSLAVMAISACEKTDIKDNRDGVAEFSMNMQADASSLKSAMASDSTKLSFQILLSVEDMQGKPVLTDEMIPLYAFGSGFISESVKLLPGEYNLTKFIVIDPSGVAVFASPLKDSPLAYLVLNPLPLKFKIQSDKVTRIVPEVLPVNNQSPDKFGYASFGIQIIKPLSFYVLCFLDNPLIMAPTQITDAKLTIIAQDGWHYSFYLERTINHIIIRGGSQTYKFILEKEGYDTQTFLFPAEKLIATTKENPLTLKIPWGPGSNNMLVLQPGPEAGIDAMISNLDPEKNFGAHKFFEATFISEPVLTVMRSNRSLIMFDRSQLPKSAIIKKVVLTLYYAPTLTTDSITLPPSGSSYPVPMVGGVLQQVVEQWEEDKVTWATQPKSIVANQVFVPRISTNNKFVDVDVTTLFVPVQEIAAPNWGMLFKQWPDNSFYGLRFASSDYPVPEMRPKLTIFYSLF